MKQINSGKYPIHIVRFEDFILDKKTTLENLMKFCLAMDDISGTNAMRRVEEIANLGDKAGVTYKLKANSNKLNA